MTSQDKPKGYMQELDEWIEESVIAPLCEAYREYSDEHIAEEEMTVKKAIRQKVLESYHNGQRASTVRAAQPKRYASR